MCAMWSKSDHVDTVWSGLLDSSQSCMAVVAVQHNYVSICCRWVCELHKMIQPHECYECHALQFTLYTFSMDLHRVPCVVFDQAAVSAQSDLAGATAPRRRNSTALWSLPAELAAVSTHKFLGYLHEIVSSEMSGRGSDFIMRIKLLTMEVLMMYQARYIQNFLDSRPTP